MSQRRANVVPGTQTSAVWEQSAAGPDRAACGSAASDDVEVRREARTLEALDAQRGLLGAADALEKWASAIHEWPFAERTPTLMITIVTSVVAMTIGRLIMEPFGL